MSKIQTASGRLVDVTNVQREDISLGDIATALANTCRFNGHVKSFYSVAQHSVLASLLVEAPVGSSDRDVLMLQRAALLHDAHEAYTGDIPWPLQHLAMHLDDCKYGISGTILEAFGLPRSLPGWIVDAVHAIDAVLLATEKRDVLPVADVKWPTDPGPAHAVGSIRPIGPNEARARICVDGPRAFAVRRIDGDLTSATRERGSDGPPIDRKPAPTPAPPPPTRRQP